MEHAYQFHAYHNFCFIYGKNTNSYIGLSVDFDIYKGWTFSLEEMLLWIMIRYLGHK